LPGGTEENDENLRIIDVQSEILTKHLTSVSLKHRKITNPKNEDVWGSGSMAALTINLGTRGR
jgi:hypothetical protein